MQEKNILIPLRYRHYFKQALTAKELFLWQFRTQLSPSKLKKELNTLVHQGKIRTQNNYYFLPHFDFKEKDQKRKRLLAKKKISLAKKRLQKIKIPSTILFIGLTGSVAAGYANQEDDLDLVIVTQKGSLWWSRFFFYFLNPHLPRRRPGQEKNLTNLFCLNLWLETCQLTFTPNLYLATEILDIVPLLDRGGLYYFWLKENKWLANFFPQLYKKRLQEQNKPSFNSSAPIWIQLINFPLFFLQYGYMLPKIKTEQVSLAAAFFHRRDYSQVSDLNIASNY